jgi:ABC-type transporter Mla subunit MlaD
MRRSQQPAFANPVLIGAVTVLVAVVAVFLAYNANSGLPFVPTRELRVVVANGAAVVPGNDVLEGGFRVGVVSGMRPVLLRGGGVGAELVLQLNTRYGRVPVDSFATIRPRSVLGLKYVDLVLGRSRRVFADGGVLPLRQTAVPVQFDDLNKMFDARTRPAVQRNLAGFGDVLAGRGGDLNDTVASLPALFRHLGSVAGYLSDPRTGLSRFLGALGGFFATVSPVARANEELFAEQATTYAAIAHSAGDLESTIRQSPPTLDVSTASLRAQQPFLVDLRTFAGYLGPATVQLRLALPEVDAALAAGVRVLPRTPSVNGKLEGVLAALRALAGDPGTGVALNGLVATVGILNPMIRYLGPYVTVCGSFTNFFAELQDLISEQTSFGTAQRALINFANHQTNNVGSQGAYAPANGYDQSNPADVAAEQQTGGADAEYAHGPAYGAAIDSQGFADCEAGQRGYELRQNYLDPQHRDLVSDAHTPGDQGPTYGNGRPRVPAGETFSRSPQTGPQLPFIPGNN